MSNINAQQLSSINAQQMSNTNTQTMSNTTVSNKILEQFVSTVEYGLADIVELECDNATKFAILDRIQASININAQQMSNTNAQQMSNTNAQQLSFIKTTELYDDYNPAVQVNNTVYSYINEHNAVESLEFLDQLQSIINIARQQVNTPALQQDNEPTIKELFEQADEIISKPVYEEYEVLECENGQVVNQTTYGEVKRTSLKRESNVKKAAAKRSKSVDAIVEKVATPKPNAYRDAKSQQAIDDTKAAALAIKPEKVSNYSTKQRVKSTTAPKAEKAKSTQAPKTHDGRTYAELRTFISTMTKANADCKKIAQGIAKRYNQKSWATAGWQGYQEIYDAIKSYQ